MAAINRDGVVASVAPGVDTTQYSTGDLLGSVQKISNVAENKKGLVVLRNIVVTETTNQKSALDIVFFNANPGTLGGNNNAVDITDLTGVLGRVTIATTDYTTLKAATNAEATKLVEVLLGCTAGLKDIWVALIVRGTPTYALNGLNLKLFFERL